MLSAVNFDGVWMVFPPSCAQMVSSGVGNVIKLKNAMYNWAFADIFTSRPTTVDRTFPSHPYFTTSFQDGQRGLYDVLHAYSVADEEVGYCQGMSYIAGIFLIHVSLNERLAAQWNRTS